MMLKKGKFEWNMDELQQLIVEQQLDTRSRSHSRDVAVCSVPTIFAWGSLAALRPQPHTTSRRQFKNKEYTLTITTLGLAGTFLLKTMNIHKNNSCEERLGNLQNL